MTKKEILTEGLLVKEKYEKPVIQIKNLTKDYGSGRGNFDISMDIYPGEAIGLVGENGAGKTTLIRQIMGFIKPTKGTITIYGLDAYKKAAETKQYIGYVPGEINFPDLKSGSEFLHEYARRLNVKDFSYADTIIKRLQLDIRAYPKRMSKGMKQKTAIVSALMLQAPIIILDEPTTGLDPLMRDEFLQIVLEEKQRGATIVMSSNTVEELETVCDRVALITKGSLKDIANVKSIKTTQARDYKIEFNDKADYEAFVKNKNNILRLQPQFNQVTIRVEQSQLSETLDELSAMNLKFISQVPYDLKTYFDERSIENDSSE